jgi:D-aminopeptidase
MIEQYHENTWRAPKPRARDLGISFAGVTGPFNAITDVPGVLVGYSTILEDTDSLPPPQGAARTGVTAILPRGRNENLAPVWAGFHALNGNGEVTGTHWIRHAGHFYGPICLTNTHGVGAVHEGATRWMIRHHLREFSEQHIWAMPVVGETYDGRLNDINGLHVRPEHALAAIDAAASGPVAEGNVGGGAGMIAYEFKGGTGTSSRMVSLGGEQYAIGVLVQANHGIRDWFTVLGVPVGQSMARDRLMSSEQGSIIVVIGTDIPVLPHQLERMAQRGTIGIGRNGTPGGNNSGDMFLAFSVANPVDREAFIAGQREMTCIPDEWFDPIYLAIVQATEEAVVNAMLAAEDVTTCKPAGKICKAIDPDDLVRALRTFGRMD